MTPVYLLIKLTESAIEPFAIAQFEATAIALPSSATLRGTEVMVP